MVENNQSKPITGVLRPSLNGKVKFCRIPIRRKNPEEILNSPWRNSTDLERKIRALVAWYEDFEPDHNFIIDVTITALSDNEIKEINGREQDDGRDT